ncbi:MAG: hypothetical protein IE931_03325 [Sphingobacteriales bacterium]|nr:hypothetical protein [Sphingobacteriales bacterium]
MSLTGGKGNAVDDFVKLLGKHSKDNTIVQTSWVISSDIDWENKTMTAKGVTDDLEFYNISLGLGAVTIKPKQGTNCLIGIIENQGAAAFLIDAEEVEEFSLKIDESEFKLDLNGFKVKKGDDSLKSILTEVVDQMLKIYAPKDVAGITAIKLKINNLLQ